MRIETVTGSTRAESLLAFPRGDGEPLRTALSEPSRKRGGRRAAG